VATTTTFLVECFWPGVTEGAHAAATARAGAAAAALRARGIDITFLGGELVPDDEVAFYRFAAADRSDVELVSSMADLPYERIVPYIA
jgi:hypothetical protein